MPLSAFRTVLVGSVLAASSLAAFAQTTGATPSTPPTPVGVTPQAAAAANQKAVPRTDTATVVRTGPTAAERMENIASEVMPNSTSTSTTAPNVSATESGVRPAKPDRN